MDGNPHETTKPEPLTGDAKLRAENPGLQELWDQYQTMRKLLSPAKEPNTKATDILAMIRQQNKSSNIAYQELEKDQRVLDKRRRDLEK